VLQRGLQLLAQLREWLGMIFVILCRQSLDVYLAKLEVDSMHNCQRKASLQESLDAVEKNVEYINKIVVDLQDYARPLKPFARETNLKETFESLFSRIIALKSIKISFCLENDAKRIITHPDLLNRILGNLVINSIQAMPAGGKLNIHAYRDENDYVITVKDTSVGIPEEVKGKLFAPLFTTKSKGQGFGLAVVKRLTEALGGTITFESKEGKGTTFMVRLPPKSALC
jgi:signal transduction histidine kinase